MQFLLLFLNADTTFEEFYEMFERRILIVDDQPQQLRLVADILKDMAIQISVALTTQQALNVMTRTLPDLLLLDVQLGRQDLNGFEFCQQLKEKVEFRDIPILFMTGNRDNYTIDKSFEVGGSDYIAKPFTERGLKARVMNQLMLVQEKRRSQMAYDELNQFAHTVSHDLKSPLLLIEQLAQCLMTQNLSKAQQEQFMSQMIEKCQQTTAMVTKLLELSKLSELEIVQEEVEASSLIRQLIGEFEQLYPDQTFKVLLGEVPDIKGDKTLLRLLFQNILSNAFKFSHKAAQPTIDISSNTLVDGVEIIVRDNGVGFDSRHAEKLFQIFERLHTTSEFEGTGLGLVISQKIMAKHGGQITLDSNGNSTSVRLIFPKHSIIS
jgi:signal transduction histidine kinase